MGREGKGELQVACETGVCVRMGVWCEPMTAERRSNHQEALQYVFHLSCKDSAKTMDMTLEVCDTGSITDAT